MIHRKCDAVPTCLVGQSRPHAHRKFPPATNDVLLFPEMAVSRGGHAFLGIHQLLAILWLFCESHQDKSKLSRGPETKIGHIPSRLGWERPAVCTVTVLG